jgi:TonB family protein
MLGVVIAMLLQGPAATAPAAPAGATPETAVLAGRGDYRVWPSAYDWYLATPQLVHSHGLAGRVVLLCKVTDFGDLARCSVKEETPRGYGFGRAAMTLRQKVKMVPTPKGQTRWVLVPFAWDKSEPYNQPGCC